MFEGGSLIDKYSNSGSSSIFDSRNQDHASNNMFGGQSIYAEVNKRSSNHNQVNIIDRMRGIQGSKLDMSDDLSLAEQYNDKTLDKRTFGGSYQITISDIYKDKSLMKDHFGLYTDSMVKPKESLEYEGERELSGNIGVSDLSDFGGKRQDIQKEDSSSNQEFKEYSFEQKSFRDVKTFRDKEPENKIEKDIKIDELNINGGSTGIYATKYDPSIYEKSGPKDESEEEKRKKRNQRIKTTLHGGQGVYSTKRKSLNIKTKLNIRASERPLLNQELLLKSKEVQLRNNGEQIFTSKDIEEGNVYSEMSYTNLNKLCSDYELKAESAEEIQRGILLKEISIIKPILIKKAIHNDF